jgi:sulfopyruvate decarboxylase subunit beta
MGLGIALCRPDLKVVVLDGDGSVLMNLGGLTTMARYRPANLTHVIFDNESLLSVGGFPTATSTGTDLRGIAAAAGTPHTVAVDTIPAFKTAFLEARDGEVMSTIVAKVEASYEPPADTRGFVTALGLLENRFQFARFLGERAEL